MLIETERLLLPPLTLEHLEEILAMNAEPEVVEWMGHVDPATASERLLANERSWAERGHGLVAIVERATGRFAGRSGLRYWPEFDETEVGWVLRPDAWGRGYATEAGRACADWGLRNLHVPYLTAMIRPDNRRSISVAERLGMRRLRDDVLLGGPVVVYALERPVWAGG